MNHFKISFYKTQVIFLNSTKIKQLKALSNSIMEENINMTNCLKSTKNNLLNAKVTFNILIEKRFRDIIVFLTPLVEILKVKQIIIFHWTLALQRNKSSHL